MKQSLFIKKELEVTLDLVSAAKAMIMRFVEEMADKKSIYLVEIVFRKFKASEGRLNQNNKWIEWNNERSSHQKVYILFTFSFIRWFEWQINLC